MSIKLKVKKRLFEDNETPLQPVNGATPAANETTPTTNGAQQPVQQPALQLALQQALQPTQLVNNTTQNASTNQTTFDPNKFVQETQAYYVELVKNIKTVCLPDNILKFIPSYNMLKEMDPYKGKEAEFAAATMKLKDAKEDNVQECLQDFTNVLVTMLKYINGIVETAKLQAANASTGTTAQPALQPVQPALALQPAQQPAQQAQTTTTPAQ